MSERDEGLTADILFVAATRPPTRWGVPYLAILVNMVFTMEFFLMAKNPLVLLLAIPIHGVCVLLCMRDIRFFELALLWTQTRLPALAANVRAWKANSYSPLPIDLPRISGRRRGVPQLYL